MEYTHKAEQAFFATPHTMPAHAKQTFCVVDRRTGATVSRHSTKKAARRNRDKLDLAYGAIRYTVREL